MSCELKKVVHRKKKHMADLSLDLCTAAAAAAAPAPHPKGGGREVSK